MKVIKNVIFAKDKKEDLDFVFSGFHTNVCFDHCGLYLHYLEDEDFYWSFTLKDKNYYSKNLEEFFDLLKKIKKNYKNMLLVCYTWSIGEVKAFFEAKMKKGVYEVILENFLLLRDVRGIVPCGTIEEFASDWLKTEVKTIPSDLFAAFSDEAEVEYTAYEKGKGYVFKTCAQYAKFFIKKYVPKYHSKWMGSVVPYKDDYDFIRSRVFRASLCMTGGDKIFEDVYSWDQASAHAHKLVVKEFPIDRPYKAAMNKSLAWYFKNKFCWFNAHFKGIIQKPGFEHLDPFKVRGHRNLVLAMDMIQLEAFKLFYDYDSLEIKDLIVADKGFIPEYLRKAIADLYKNKAEYPTKDAHRNKLKIILNSGSYGISVEGTHLTDEEFEELIDSKFFSIWKRRLIPPQIGVTITSYVFLDECKIIAADPQAFAYCDTDSIKAISTKKIVDAIEKRNCECDKEIKNFCKDFDYDYTIMQDLGKYKPDGAYRLFKAMLPKEYMYMTYDGKLGATTAGYAKHYSINDLPKDCHYKFEDDKIQAILYQPLMRKLDPFEYFERKTKYIDYRWIWDNKAKKKFMAEFKLTAEENAKLTYEMENSYKKVTQ